MRFLFCIIMFLVGIQAQADIGKDMALLTQKRLLLEEVSLEMQKKSERLQQEIDVLEEKLQESKNAQLKERLKIATVENQLREYSDVKSIDSQALKMVGTMAELELLHTDVKSFMSRFRQSVYFKKSWQEALDDLEVLYRRQQMAAYQVRLGQLLEKLIFESNQVEYAFETVHLEGPAETVEMLRLGHWMSIAKTPQAYWLYNARGEFEKREDLKGILGPLIPQVKSRTLSFIPQDLLDLKKVELAK